MCELCGYGCAGVAVVGLVAVDVAEEGGHHSMQASNRGGNRHRRICRTNNTPLKHERTHLFYLVRVELLGKVAVVLLKLLVGSGW